MTIQPYLNFDGRCDEAIDFYRKALGAEVEILLRFKDCPEPPSADEGCTLPDDPEKVMHTCLRIGDAAIMASDCNGTGRPEFKGISLSLTAADEAEADRYFDALATGGQVHMPMGRTFFSPRFGVVADKFGVSWMICVEPEQG
jgi:PhnB protein